jgi:hypothetical protein
MRARRLYWDFAHQQATGTMSIPHIAQSPSTAASADLMNGQLSLLAAS